MRKKIIIMVPVLQLGGQERVAVKTAELLMNVYDVSLLIFDDSDMAYSPKCNVICINSPASNNIVKKAANIVKRTLLVKTIRKKQNVNAVYSFGFSANLINVLSKGIGKTIVGIRTYTSKESYKLVDSFVFNNCDLIISCSNKIKEAIIELHGGYKKKIKCLNNPVDVDEIIALGDKTVSDYSFSPITIVSHGRLDRIKNWPRLIKAYSIVSKEFSDSKLLIIGEGDQRKDLQALIKEYCLEDKITLLGYKKNPFSYLSKSQLYVLPSFYEGFPNALLEGMVFMPVVSVDCLSGPREILSKKADSTVIEEYSLEDYGVLVSRAKCEEYSNKMTDDDKALAHAICTVLRDRELMNKYQKLAKRRVLDYSCDAYKEKLLEMLI